MEDDSRPGALADPVLQLRGADGGLVLENDDWDSTDASLVTTSASLGAFPLAHNAKDAAALFTLGTATQGTGFSVRITSADPAASGTVLAEIYDAGPSLSAVRLTNVSTLGVVDDAAGTMVAGFVIRGTTAKSLLIRAVGPGLATFGVGGALPDPRFAVIPAGLSFAVAESDNWDGSRTTRSACIAAGAFPLTAGSLDAALATRLPPGAYTVLVSGSRFSSGIALVEIYDLDP